MKKDSKKEEVQAPSEKSADEIEPSQTKADDTAQPTEAEEQVKILEEQNKKLEKERDDFKRAFFKEQEKPREKIVETVQETVQDDVEDEYTADQRKLVKEELDKRDVKVRKDNLEGAIQEFIDENPQYSEENDLGNLNWNKLNPLIKSTAFSGSKEEMKKRIGILHRGITKDSSATPPESDTETVDDSGVASVATSPPGTDKQPDALTRPLDRHEQQAADVFKGGEKEYRKKLAEMEATRKK